MPRHFRSLITPLLWLFLASLFLSRPAAAHELRPAFLSISETAPAETGFHYDILWKTPVSGQTQLALTARFPDDCQARGAKTWVASNRFAIKTWRLSCPKDLRGQSIEIAGLENTLTDVLIKARWADGTELSARLTPQEPRLEFAAPRTGGGVVRTYFGLGVEHILTGTDHLLFVLAVILLVQGSRRLFLAVTAFTLGHSITLALATLGLVHLNGALVELLIALSIVLMAYEAARFWQGKSGLTAHYPWVVTFSFGLLHGFGFASALRELGLPQTEIPAALLFFNLGVEAGQLLFIAVILALASLPGLRKIPTRPRLMQILSTLIGSCAVFWTLERIAPVFWG